MVTIKRKKKVVKKDSRRIQMIKLAEVFDDLCHGKVMGRILRRKFIKYLVDYFEASEPAMSTVAEKHLAEIIESDSKEIGIKKSFPKLSVQVPYIELKRSSYSPLTCLLISVLYLSDMQKNEDLFVDTFGAAICIESLRQISKMATCLQLIVEGKNILPEHFSELQQLKTMANSYSLAGTHRLLPEVTIDLVEKSENYIQILSAIKKFPVAEDLQRLQRENSTKLKDLLEDIGDIFKDYTIGEVRKNALELFPAQCKKFTLL